MATSYLTKEELSKKFYTLEMLAEMCGDHDSRHWGLYQKDDVVEIGVRGAGWTLQVSLDSLYERAMERFCNDGDLDTERIVVVYGVEPKNNNLGIDLYELAEEDGSLRCPTRFREKEVRTH